jgi:pyrroline-5-carboxylate reductase
MPIKIAFIGAGRMASAIVRGLLEQKHYLPSEIACTCGNDPSGPQLAADTGISYFQDIVPAAKEADAILLACKPQQFDQIDAALVAASQGSLILSILAGTTLKRLESKFTGARNIVRTMPNTPGQIGAGVTAYAPINTLEPEDLTIVEKTLSSLGKYHLVNESDLDAVTALSGSGPAYVFEFCAALREAGIQAGLSPELSLDLAIQTLLGSSKLLAASDLSAEELRIAVTSPGGTTAAALNTFEQGDLRGLVNQAIQAAKARSIELGQG